MTTERKTLSQRHDDALRLLEDARRIASDMEDELCGPNMAVLERVREAIGPDLAEAHQLILDALVAMRSSARKLGALAPKPPTG